MRSSNRRAAAKYAFSASSVHVSANEQQSAACRRRRVAQDARSYIHTYSGKKEESDKL